MISHNPRNQFSQGLAYGPGRARHPHLWNGLDYLYVPSVGNQGMSLYNFALGKRGEDGIMTNMASTAWRGRSIFLDGGNDFIDMDSFEDDPKVISFMCWARFDSPNDANQSLALFGHRALSGTTPLIQLILQASAGVPVDVRLQYRSSTSGVATIIDTNITTFTEWHHYAFVFDNNNGDFRLYTDGQLIGANTGVVSGNFSSTKTRLGHFFNGAANGHFKGDLDDVRIYSRALTTNDFQQALVASPLDLPPTIHAFLPPSGTVFQATGAIVAQATVVGAAIRKQQATGSVPAQATVIGNAIKKILASGLIPAQANVVGAATRTQQATAAIIAQALVQGNATILSDFDPIYSTTAPNKVEFVQVQRTAAAGSATDTISGLLGKPILVHCIMFDDATVIIGSTGWSDGSNNWCKWTDDGGAGSTEEKLGRIEQNASAQGYTLVANNFTKNSLDLVWGVIGSGRAATANLLIAYR